MHTLHFHKTNNNNSMNYMLTFHSLCLLLFSLSPVGRWINECHLCRAQLNLKIPTVAAVRSRLAKDSQATWNSKRASFSHVRFGGLEIR